METESQAVKKFNNAGCCTARLDILAKNKCLVTFYCYVSSNVFAMCAVYLPFTLVINIPSLCL